MASSPNSSETMGRSPLRECDLGSLFDPEREPKVRKWSQFELNTVCSLICRFEHEETSKEKTKKQPHTGDTSSELLDTGARNFATKLNTALHGTRTHMYNISVSDARELLDFVEIEHKPFMELIKRQPAPFRITRTKRSAFQRVCLNFNDAFYKWTMIRRVERRVATSIAEQPLARDDLVEYYESVAFEVHNYRLGPVQKSAQLSKCTRRGWMSNSVYAQRGRDLPDVNTASVSGQTHRAHSPQRSILSAMSDQRLRHQNRRRIIRQRALALFHPDHQVSPLNHENIQYSNTRTNTETEGGIHPNSLAFNNGPSPTSTPELPPTSSCSSHDSLRQGVLPMVPSPRTPLSATRSPLERDTDLAAWGSDVLGQLALPVFSSPVKSPISQGYHSPNLSQESGNPGDTSVVETRDTPLSPLYMTNSMSTGMTGTEAEAEPPFESIYGTDDMEELFPISGSDGAGSPVHQY
ncbi:hypothetical protein F5Y09DRAFT_349728 [Xylaria sp. FL1042]|nr:hypothetical protein F5Y09DRAFT_349728 [Xylaria sp. FL1042]